MTYTIRKSFLILGVFLIIYSLPETKASHTGLQCNTSHCVSVYQSTATDNEPKSKALAVAYSTGFTALPIAAGLWLDQLSFKLIGLIYGPATGIIYGGDIAQTWSGVIIRGVSGLGILIGYIGSLFDETAPTVLLIGSAVFAGGSALWDTFYKAPNTVDRYNQQIAKPGEISATPWTDASNRVAGVSARFHF